MMKRSTGTLFGSLLGALALSSAGCEGCLGIDKYELVPAAGAAGASGAGGTGGASDCNADGALFVSAAEDASAASSDLTEPCALASAVDAGIEVRAFDPFASKCLARARIVATKGAALESPPRVRFSEGRVAHVSATFRGGSLELPPKCGSGEKVVVDEGAGAMDTLMIAALKLEGAAFCTSWVERAFTAEPSAKIRVNAMNGAETGAVTIVGSLGGALVQLEGGSSATEAHGGPFFARYQSDGTLAEAVALDGGRPADAAMDVAQRDNQWLITGAALREQAACYGCAGTVSVTEPASAMCAGPMTGSGGSGGAGGMTGSGGSGGAGGMTGSGGSGGSGGMTGSGGSGGMAGSGGAGGMAGSGGAPQGPDSQNAFWWSKADGGAQCSLFATFGSDHQGDQDAQAGMGLSAWPAPGACTVYWAGLAGREAWRLGGSDTTALFDAGGASMDGFVARFDGGDSIGCTGAAGASWSVRLTPVEPGAAAVAERVSAEERCSKFGQLTATAFVRSAAGSNLSLYRCLSDTGCDDSAPILPLSAGNEQHLVVLGLDQSGTAQWSMAVGPVKADDDAAAGTFSGRSHHDIARDSGDNVYVVFTTTGPLSLKNLDTSFNCQNLVESLSAGTYLLRLRSLASSKAQCEWATRIGP